MTRRLTTSWTSGLQRWSPGTTPARVETSDIGVVAAFCALDLLVFWSWWKLPHPPTLQALMPVGASVITFGCLLLRRRHPVGVICVVWVLMLAESLLPSYEPLLAVLVALYAVASRRGGGTSLGALLLSAMATAVVVIGTINPVSARAVPSVSVWVLIDGAVWAIGVRMRSYALQTADLEERRRAAAGEAVEAERLRIARDLHDILAHSVSVMVLQAAGARAVLSSDARRTEQALAAIEGIGSQAMDELRRLLTVLRASSGEGDAADIRRQPGLADLDDLIAVAEDAGARVTVERHGTCVPLDPSVELAVYRLVQEALTNARKYAGQHPQVRIRLLWGDHGLQVVIDDTAPEAGPAPAARDMGISTGYGLLGLRERVSAVGGTFAAGPRTAGFRVEASLPRSTSPAGGAPVVSVQ